MSKRMNVFASECFLRKLMYIYIYIYIYTDTRLPKPVCVYCDVA